MYTDASKVDDNIGFSACIFNKLNHYNYVYQAELSAINFAAGWALDKGVQVKMFSDSVSSLDTLSSTSINSSLILDIKQNIFKAKNLVSFTSAKAHAGIPGNELADQFAKIATDCDVILNLPAPYSYTLPRPKSWIRH
ncbi:hypothetical protein AVEN_253159-1 [Araneus ventricosus]|uniref:RNase H type-1 domain-containing protein n=1 Tax=Araneus ventricosus TaxID=182803 RepID=A0A4Y2RGR1_ARAVE|nr:hypothetical protein AVEN_253159-1 [Araneus ventricosus]